LWTRPKLGSEETKNDGHYAQTYALRSPRLHCNSQHLSVLHAFRTYVVEENQVSTLCQSHTDGRPNISEGNVSLVTDRTYPNHWYMHTFPNLFLPFAAAVTATIQEVAVCVCACVCAYVRVCVIRQDTELLCPPTHCATLLCLSMPGSSPRKCVTVRDMDVYLHVVPLLLR
jgi:hypothetical protein